MSLLDLIALEDLQQLQDTLADINQVASVITEPEGNPLTMPSNEFEVCHLVRQSELGSHHCNAMDNTIQVAVQAQRQPVQQTCPVFGIQKAAIPIFIDGHHLANWWINQFHAPLPSREQLVAYAQRIGVDASGMIREFEKVSIGDSDGFRKIMDWTDRLAHRIAYMGYQNFALSRNLSKLQRIENELDKHRAQVDVLVQKRTAELTDINTRLQLEVMEKDLIEEQIARRSKLLDAINRIFKLTLDTQSDTHLPQAFLEAAQDITGSAFGLYVERQESGWKVVANSYPQSNALPEGPTDRAATDHFEMKGFWQELVERGDPVTIAPLDEASDWQPLPGGYPKVNSLLAIPLKPSLKASGFIALANNETGYAPVDQSDVETLAQTFLEALTRRRTEKTRSDNQMRLHLALESANEGLWDFNPLDDYIYYSKRWFGMLGYLADEFPQTLETWRTLAHPDNLPLLEGALNALSAGHEETFNIEIRMLSRSGQWRWIQVVGKSVGKDEQGQVTRIVGTLSDISKYKQVEVALQKANDELLRLAALDDLTQIANRRRFDDRLAQEWRRAQRDENNLAIIICDIDYFKNYNDTYGHLKGDETLYAVAQAICATLKRPMDLIARYGGEEFAMVLPATGVNGAKRVANEAKKAIANLAIEHKDSEVSPHITLSFGIAATVPQAGSMPKELIKAADQALYLAKAQGRDKIVAVSETAGESINSAGTPNLTASEKTNGND